MKTFFLLFCSALLGMTGLQSITETTLTGVLTDAATKEPLIGATVKITQNRTLIKGVITDVTGKYTVSLNPGTYEVEFSYTGYTAQRITEVQLVANQKNTLDASLASGAVLNECVVVHYKDRLIKADDLESGTTLGEERLAYRSEAVATKAARKKGEVSRMVAPTGKAETKPATVAPAPPPRPTESMDLRIGGRDASTAEPVVVPARPTTPPELSVEEFKSIPEPTELTADKIIREKDLDGEAPSPGIPAQPTPRAGLLTAGEWNDLHNWNTHWLDLLNDGEITQYETMYGFFPKNRFAMLLTNEQDFPVADAVVQLLDADGKILWEAHTDNTGKAELWANLFDQKEATGLQAIAWVNGQKHPLGQPKPGKDGLNRHQISVECSAPKNVDIVWAVDATGSMGDEIEYLKTELLDVIGRAKSHNPELAFRMGTVFYRDQGDEYLTKSSGLSPDIAQTVEFIKKQFAGGGGDYPEAVHTALEEAIFSQKWSASAIARICFLVLDASPHQSPEVNASLQRSIREAARLGIRIVPVTASGIQKDTEFLMKFFGLATNGSYVFLTDHSGIGGHHIEPTTDEYKVEQLNDLLVRLITEYTTIKTCNGQSAIRFEDPQSQPNRPPNNWQALYYPNPASTQFTLDLPFAVQSVTIYDAEGKAVRKLEKPQAGLNTVTVSDLAPGFYTIRILKDGQMQSGKLMIVRN